MLTYNPAQNKELAISDGELTSHIKNIGLAGGGQFNPVIKFAADPDSHLKAILQASGVTYLGENLYERAKSIGLAVCAVSEPTVRDMVQAWRKDAELFDFADAVERAMLPSR